MRDRLPKLYVLAGAALVLTAVFCEAVDVALGPDQIIQPFVLAACPLMGLVIAWDARRLRKGNP